MVIWWWYGISLGSLFWNLVGIWTHFCLSVRTSILLGDVCDLNAGWYFSMASLASRPNSRIRKSQSHHRLKCGWVYPVYHHPAPLAPVSETTWRLSPNVTLYPLRLEDQWEDKWLCTKNRHLKSGCSPSFWPSTSQFFGVFSVFCVCVCAPIFWTNKINRPDVELPLFLPCECGPKPWGQPRLLHYLLEVLISFDVMIPTVIVPYCASTMNKQTASFLLGFSHWNGTHTHTQLNHGAPRCPAQLPGAPIFSEAEKRLSGYLQISDVDWFRVRSKKIGQYVKKAMNISYTVWIIIKTRWVSHWSAPKKYQRSTIKTHV